jgi:tRNA A-37 threonylcarbamoyl transferase component Bud32
MSLLPRDDALALIDRKQIDEICLAFEDEWLAGHRPVMEVYLRQVNSVNQPTLLKELLLLELDYRRSTHDVPQVDDYLTRFPACSASVQAAFHAACTRDVSVRHLPGSLIGRYRVRRMLGAGAFAAVYLAWDEQLRREVAVKVPHPSRLGDAGERQRFVEEARAIARLKHPLIVAIYDAAELEDGTVYLVMQYVAGQSLRQLLDHGAMPPEQACCILAEVADAIDAAHRAGVIHRDLKPSNILLDELGQPHVCDFGLALEEGQQRERRGEYAGTLSYMAPEQLRGESHQLDGRADIWAGGVILYEMLTGRQPFLGRDRQDLTDEILTRDPRPPRQMNSHIRRSVERVCLRCLEKRPAHRYPTAADVAEDLRSAGAGGRSQRVRLAGLYGGLLLMAMLLLSPAVAMWWNQDRPADIGPLPLQGSIELMVWNPTQSFRQGVQIGDDHAVPLRSGDRVRLAVELNRPAYAYVVWLDTQGVPAPVYTWRLGDWQNLPATCQSTVYFTLPEEPGAGWGMRTSRGGMETLLLLARHSPLPADVSLRELLAAIPNATIPCRPNAMRFREGRPLPAEPQEPSDPTHKVTRDPVLDRPVAINDPLLKLQQELVNRLRPHFDLIYAVSFPVQED